VDEQQQPVFEQVVNGNMVLCDELRAHESVLGVLDQLSEVYHQAPGERSLGLETLKEDGADLFFDRCVTLIEED